MLKWNQEIFFRLRWRYRPHGPSLKEAAVETIMTVIFSTIPLWLFPIFSPIIFNVGKSTREQLYENLRTGEFFLYAVAMLGPILYVTTYKYLDSREEESGDGVKKTVYKIDFPLGRTLACGSAIMAVIFGAIFGSIRLNYVIGSPLQLNYAGTIYSSASAYIFSILCFCLTAYFRNCVTNSAASDLMRNDEKHFLDGWRERS